MSKFSNISMNSIKLFWLDNPYETTFFNQLQVETVLLCISSIFRRILYNN
jgi:hypothetical protein